MDIRTLLETMVSSGASDLFCRVGGVARFRVDGQIQPVNVDILTVKDLDKFVEEFQQMVNNKNLREELNSCRSTNFAVFLEGLGRFRVNIFYQRNTLSFVTRYVQEQIRTFHELSLPENTLKSLSEQRRGLVLVTGAAGSGKSTTIASMIQYINTNYPKHILSIEEPIEFLFKDKAGFVNQRELGIDVDSYPSALWQFTLQSPDVIYIGTIRDQQTMGAAITAAETGVLVLSTLHTINAVQTVERIINFFPPYQHQEVLMQLSMLLKGVLSLRLVPRRAGQGRIPAYEIMTLSPTVSRLLREGKIWELGDHIEQGEIYGMKSFRQTLLELVRDGLVNKEEALQFADSKEDLELGFEGFRLQ